MPAAEYLNMTQLLVRFGFLLLFLVDGYYFKSSPTVNHKREGLSPFLLKFLPKLFQATMGDQGARCQPVAEMEVMDN